jgi:hypothetical protein
MREVVAEEAAVGLVDVADIRNAPRGPQIASFQETTTSQSKKARNSKLEIRSREARKSEYRNPKSETNPKHKTQMIETLSPLGWSVLNFEFGSFVLVSFRYSD